MTTHSPPAREETPVMPPQLHWAVPAALALAVAGISVVQPIAAFALLGGVLFFAGYFFRRDLLLGCILVGLLFQNLFYLRLLPVQAQLANAIKHADDILLLFFAPALVIETFLPVVRLSKVPRWRPFAALVAVCLLSALANRLPSKQIAVGTYVLLKNFVWFFLAATMPLTARDYRRLVRFITAVLGAVLAFGFFQFLTGELTYSILGLPKDYRFGILRLRSIFVHPVFLAESMALLAVLMVSAYIHLRTPLHLMVAAAAATAVLLAMLAKTILALVLTLGLLLLRKRPALAIPFSIVAAGAMVVFAEYGTQNFRRQITTYLESPRSVRREGYRIAGEIMRDSPVLGLGPGSFGGFAATILDTDTRYQYGFINYDGHLYTTVEAHWPHLVAEIGLLGILAYGAFLWLAARTAWRTSNDPRTLPYQRVLCTAAPVFLVVVMVEGIAAQNMEDTLCGFMAFSMLGFAQRPPVGDNTKTTQKNE